MSSVVKSLLSIHLAMGTITIFKYFFFSNSSLQERPCKAHFLDVGHQKDLALIMLIHSKGERLAPMALAEKVGAEKQPFSPWMTYSNHIGSGCG